MERGMSLSFSLTTAKRIVIKLGTQIVVDAAGRLALERLRALADQCVALHRAGKEVILVSSGAVGLGRNRLKREGSLTLTEKQACAAVGQSLLMDAYRDLFEPAGLVTAQILLTALDFADRKHYLNLRQTLETLLKLGCLPIINENDVTSTMELREGSYTRSYIKGFGDNDKLSALVAGKLDADLLVILTNVDGIYTDNPETSPDAEKIAVVPSFQDLQQIQTAGQSALGRGGMASKLEAARLAAISGLHTYIASGLQPEPLAPLLNPERNPTGTVVLPQPALPGRKRWIGAASGYHGVVIVNDGASRALTRQGASLLPVGVTAVQGDFSTQQVVSIQDERGREIGRGLSGFSADELRRVQGVRGAAEAVHRDNLVIFEEYGFDPPDSIE
jgi:glutamate 5-kinase